MRERECVCVCAFECVRVLCVSGLVQQAPVCASHQPRSFRRRVRRGIFCACSTSRCCSSRHWCTSSGLRLKWANPDFRIARACHSRGTVRASWHQLQEHIGERRARGSSQSQTSGTDASAPAASRCRCPRRQPLGLTPTPLAPACLSVLMHRACGARWTTRASEGQQRASRPGLRGSSPAWRPRRTLACGPKRMGLSDRVG